MTCSKNPEAKLDLFGHHPLLATFQGTGFNPPAQKRKISPKTEVFGQTSLRTSGQTLRSGPPNPGKQAFWHGHAARTSTKKLWSEKLRADFSFPTTPKSFRKETEADLFPRVLFSFLPPLLATPLSPLFSAPFRPFLPFEKCSVL